MRKKKNRKGAGKETPPQIIINQKRIDEKIPKAYSKQPESSDESIAQEVSEEEIRSDPDKSEDSGLDSDTESVPAEKLENIQVSSLLSDMEKLKEDLIKRNEYEKLKEKCKQLDSEDE